MAFYEQLCAVTRIERHRIEAATPDEAAALIAAGKSYGYQPEFGSQPTFTPLGSPVFLNDSWPEPLFTEK